MLGHNHVVHLSQRVIETLIFITKTKMLKIDMLIKKYSDVGVLLENSLYLMDPRLRLNYNKSEDILMRDVIMVYTSVFI